MSGVLVGYTDTPAGHDALALGVRLAAARGVGLDTVLVLPGDEGRLGTPPDPAYERHVRAQAREWLAHAAAEVPDTLPHAGHVRDAESFAAGLVAAAAELGADQIVIGTAGQGSRHRLGTVANELLHSADVAVVLAPAGGSPEPAADGGRARIPRLTVAVGTRPGAQAVLDEAVALATATGAAVRLLSLVTVDLPASLDTGVVRVASSAHAREALDGVRARLPDGVTAEVVAAQGTSVEDAVSRLDWLQGELVLVGSSRLAQPRRLFLGSTAAKMLHALPVPMIVVPRPRTEEG